eukprot:6183718-Pleurochrysis_carterae.AAC.3
MQRTARPSPNPSAQRVHRRQPARHCGRRKGGTPHASENCAAAAVVDRGGEARAENGRRRRGRRDFCVSVLVAGRVAGMCGGVLVGVDFGRDRCEEEREAVVPEAAGISRGYEGGYNSLSHVILKLWDPGAGRGQRSLKILGSLAPAFFVDASAAANAGST